MTMTPHCVFPHCVGEGKRTTRDVRREMSLSGLSFNFFSLSLLTIIIDDSYRIIEVK